MAARLVNVLQHTISHLETIRDKQQPPSLQLIELIDELHELHIELLNAMIDYTSEEYIQVSQVMNSAAYAARQAVDDLRDFEEKLEKISKAAGQLSELLARVA